MAGRTQEADIQIAPNKTGQIRNTRPQRHPNRERPLIRGLTGISVEIALPLTGTQLVHKTGILGVKQPADTRRIRHLRIGFESRPGHQSNSVNLRFRVNIFLAWQ